MMMEVAESTLNQPAYKVTFIVSDICEKYAVMLDARDIINKGNKEDND